MKSMMRLYLLVTLACFAIISCEATEKSTPIEITEQDISDMAEKIIAKVEYNYDEYPFMKEQEYINSLKETIKLALREKVINETNAKNLRDIFDETFGRAETENYLFMRMIYRYMIDEQLNFNDAKERLREIIDKRLDNIDTFAEMASIDKLLKKDSKDIIDELRQIHSSKEQSLNDNSPDDEIEDAKPKSKINATKSENEELNKDTDEDSATQSQEHISFQEQQGKNSVFPRRSDRSTKSSSKIAGKHKITDEIKPAKDIFELLTTIEPSIKDPGKAINKILSKTPSTNKTIVKSARGSTSELLLTEKNSGNNPIAINWINVQKANGHLQEILPSIADSLSKMSKSARKGACFYSEGLHMLTANDSSKTSQIDLISCNVIDESSTDQAIRELVRMQGVMALLTGHDVLIVEMIGFNVSKEKLAKIGTIYNDELNNPLVEGKLKKVFFVKEGGSS